MDETADRGWESSSTLAACRREQLLTLYHLVEPERRAVRSACDARELIDVVELARRVTGAENCELNVIGAERQFTLSRTGGAAASHDSVPISASICSTVLDHRPGDRLVVIPDTAAEPMLRDHPAATGTRAKVGFYAGASLRSSHGWPLGMLCVWSSYPSDLDVLQRRLLVQLANSAMHILEARRTGFAAPLRAHVGAMGPDRNITL